MVRAYGGVVTGDTRGWGRIRRDGCRLVPTDRGREFGDDESPKKTKAKAKAKSQKRRREHEGGVPARAGGHVGERRGHREYVPGADAWLGLGGPGGGGVHSVHYSSGGGSAPGDHGWFALVLLLARCHSFCHRG